MTPQEYYKNLIEELNGLGLKMRHLDTAKTACYLGLDHLFTVEIVGDRLRVASSTLDAKMETGALTEGDFYLATHLCVSIVMGKTMSLIAAD